jgi:hypothetical protein
MEIRNPVGTEASPLQFHKSHPLTKTHKYTVQDTHKYGTVECCVFGNSIASLHILYQPPLVKEVLLLSHTVPYLPLGRNQRNPSRSTE